MLERAEKRHFMLVVSIDHMNTVVRCQNAMSLDESFQVTSLHAFSHNANMPGKRYNLTVSLIKQLKKSKTHPIASDDGCHASLALHSDSTHETLGKECLNQQWKHQVTKDATS